jgi:thermitase
MRSEFKRLVAVAAIACAAVFVLGADQLPEPQPGRLLVRFSTGAPDARALAAVAAVGGKIGAEIGHTGYRVVELSAGAGLQPTADTRKALCAADASLEVQYDYRVAPADVPNDPLFSSQWHLAKMQCPAAWSGTRGRDSVIIAILDTGVDGTHPDLAAKMVAGWNTYDNNADSNDVYGHGTAVAGTAAACTNNGTGVAGVAWDCLIMPVRISDPQGYGYSSTVANGLTWAADHGARVANISYGFTNDSVVRAAAKYFSDRGGVVTVSAGNSALNDTHPDNPYVLTVSATDSNDELASWSNRGNNVDVSAPGVGIGTTNRGGGYGSWSGTSFSAPATAGVAALVISANPSLTGPEVQQIVKNSADDLGTPGWDSVYAMGRVNADRAVAAALEGNQDTTPPTIVFTNPLAATPAKGTVAVEMQASDDVAVESVVLRKDGVAVATFSAAPYRWTYNSQLDADGTHRLTATASDAAGNQSTAELVLTVENADRTPPAVAFTSPAAGVVVSRSVAVKLTASDAQGVASVQLKKDGVVVATLTRAPYSWTYDTTLDKNGSHVLTAVAMDPAGNEASANLAITVNNPDRKKPTLRIASPTNRATVQGMVQVVVEAQDDQGVAYVDITKDRVLVARLTSAPYTWVYDSETDKNGSHTFAATAKDAAGNSAAATITVKVANPDVKPPTVTLTSPLPGQSLSSVLLAASASDNVKIARVLFYMDGVLVGTDTSAPYRISLSSRQVPPGPHTFHAVAVDSSGNSQQSQSVAAAK